MIVILDSGILDLLVTPLSKAIEKENREETQQCTKWLYNLTKNGVYVVTSMICDYEVRRKFIHIKSEGIPILDQLQDLIDFLPITNQVIIKAAELWAAAREQHQPTAEEKNIDVDMIISAQWSLLCEENPGRAVFIATKNVRHLKLFAKEQATDWVNIKF